MGGLTIQLVAIEAIEAPQIALVGEVQEHEAQNTRSIEGIDVPMVESELDFLHGRSLFRVSCGCRRPTLKGPSVALELLHFAGGGQ
jgi:hypothetical protein